MATTPASSSLQIAQIIADLQTLQNADPTAALALLSANKTLSPGHIRRKSQAAILPEPPKFDSLGRRIVGQNNSTPSLTRVDSLASSGFLASNGGGRTSGSNSDSGTPVIGSAPQQLDEDLLRAKTLLELFEMRGKFKQMRDNGLMRSKQTVDNVVDKYAKMELEEREKVARARHLGVPA